MTMKAGLAGRIAVAATLAMAVLASMGCGDSQEARDTREGIRVAYDTVRGAPSAKALAERSRFSNDGVAFEYPRPLRLTHETVEGDDVWTLRHGLYDLEVWVSDEVLDAHNYLDAIASTLTAKGEGKITAPAQEGRSLNVCGGRVATSTMRGIVADADARFEAFVLPAAADGKHRLLMFRDMRLGAASASTVAEATAAMVLSTLTCADGHRDGDE